MSPLPFSIAVVFITHDISFPAPPAKTHSSHTPVTCMHALTHALSWRQEAPCWPTHKAGAEKAQFALQSDSTPYAGLPLLSAAGEIDGRETKRKKEKKRKQGTNPVPLPSPARTTSSSPLAALPQHRQGFPFAESLNGPNWGQPELGDIRRLLEVRG